MSKPTLFFSHSSKDKDAVLSIKKKLDKATGGVMDIFMSSDGQSIPFGTNWIHKIEEGLQAAKIMFVFVTQSSISSGWIHFEAGYAYSKGIQVIPVGIGVDIGTLKAPLNLLQGFNILSEDSLSNFITIVNKTFDYHFESVFEYYDYVEVINDLSIETFNIIKFEEIVEKTKCEICGEQITTNGETVIYNINKFYNDIVTYLEAHEISFSRNDVYEGGRSVCLVANGVKIIYRKEITITGTNHTSYYNYAKLSFYVSPYNFLNAFTLLKHLLQLFENKETFYILLHLKENYSFITKAENGSSIISKHSEFDVDKSHIDGYVCDELGLKFYVFNYNKHERVQDFAASVVFNRDDVHAENIIKLVDKLYDIGFIFEK